MSLAQFIPSVWAARLLANLEKSLIYGQAPVVNKDYEGEISEYGDRVYVHGIGEIAVADYTRDVTTINYELLDDSRKELLINQSKYFAFKVDDLDVAQQRPKVIDSASQKATRTLADVADQYLASFYADAGTVLDDGGDPLGLTAENIYGHIVAASVALDEKNVPDQGRYLILPPWAAGLALQNEKFIAKADPPGTVLNGQIAKVAGFAILKSNNVPVTGTAPAVSHITAGHTVAISYAEQISKVEGIRLQDSFADGVRGLHLYGAEVLVPDALADIPVTPPAA
jgi:hypothetical protein